MYSDGTALDAFTVAHAVYPGDVVPVYVRTQAPSFDLEVLRIGAYGPEDARDVERRQGVTATPQPDCDPGPDGFIDCGRWKPTLSLTVGSWQSGVYMLRLTAPDGGQALVPLVVGTHQATPIVADIGLFTLEAYNAFGGTSLYHGAQKSDPRGHQVSFRRPFQTALVAHAFAGHSAALLRWLDATYGAKIGYVTDFELDAGTLDPAPRALLLVGHDEYMTLAERGRLADAVAGGGPNLAVLGANDAYWHARLVAAPDGTPRSVLVCYKDASLDPVADPAQATVRFRDLGLPPSALFGIEYSGLAPANTLYPAQVTTPSDPLFAGMGVTAGQVLGNVYGYEADGVVTAGPTPEGLRILASGHFPYHGSLATADTTFYQAPSGTRVFDAGSLEWGFGLDADGPLPHAPSWPIRALTQRALDDLLR